MPSFVIGLDIDENHVTTSLVRIEQSIERKLILERDTFYVRTFPENMKQDSRLIISGWIDCIDDLLCDFINYYQERDTIIGIACGISSPMDYERGIGHMQLSKSNKTNPFFGLNLRLLFQSGLRDLIQRRKHHHYPRYCTPPTSPEIIAEQPILISPTSHSVFHFPITRTIDKEIPNSKSSMGKLTDYCGLQENEHHETASPRPTCTQTTEITSSKPSVTIDNFSLKLQSMMDQLYNIPITFFNDTICFAIGETNNIYHQDYERILALTLDSHFGSAFIDCGEILLNRDDIPSDGILSNHSYDENFTADDCFSTRGLINIYKKLLQRETDVSTAYSLARQAFHGDQNAIKAYRIFARRLGKFLSPYIETFRPNLLLISGEIAQAWYLFENELHRTLQKFDSIEIYFSLFNEKSICLGAVQQQQLPSILTSKTRILRHTDQHLLPVVKINNSNQYSFYPSHEIPIGYIGIGHKQLNEKMFRLIQENHILLIDGFLGTDFDEFAQKLNEYYFQQRRTRKLRPLLFYDTRILLRTEKNLKKDFIDLKKLSYLQINLSYPCVIIGYGASFINETSPLIYIDLPINELHYRIPHLKSNDMDEEKMSYRFDYRIFSRLKQELLSRMNFFVDGQRPNCPTWLDGETFRQALVHISNQPICIRPWLRTADQNLSKILINSGRSSKMMTSENGIILSDTNQHLIEFSWDIFYSSQANRMLGNDIHYRLFNRSNDLPICFNLMDNENLSKMSTNLKEQPRQDRVYYIIKTKPYSQKESNASSPQDFFLMPDEAIHATGRNEIILEISARSNVDDDSQSLNKKHRVKTVQFIPRTKQSSSRPLSVRVESKKYEEQQLPTPDFYIYTIQRLIIEANESIETIRSTENRFHLCILIEGDAIEIEFNSIDNKHDKQIRQYNSIEPFLIPASIDEYRLRPIIKNQVKTKESQRYVLLISFLK